MPQSVDGTLAQEEKSLFQFKKVLLRQRRREYLLENSVSVRICTSLHRSKTSKLCCKRHSSWENDR